MSAYATTKKIVPLLICSLAVLSPRGAAQPAVEMPQTIRVVVDDAYAPYSFESDGGKRKRGSKSRSTRWTGAKGCGACARASST